MISKRTPLILALLCCGVSMLFAQAGVTGVWLARTPNGDGTFRKMVLDLKQDGAALTGRMIMNYRPMPIPETTVTNGKFHFELGRAPRQRTVEGSLDGEHLLIEERDSSGKVLEHVTAERTTLAAVAPPAPLPLPALHDVPDNGLVRTPPMGWNSWNHFHHNINDKTVRETADALVSSGMVKAGYIYLNIDDTWEDGRDANGNILTNTKFPDMKALADYVHSKGLKLGIYSSPGPTTCAAYEGSLGHEKQDAETYAKWGIDYLKYDWCGAGAIYKDSDMRAAYQKMGDALQAPGRPIVFSLCQYGRDDVWTWGAKVGGNLWRTTGDISDNWASMSRIGFSQLTIAPFIRAGHWNDPDMLEIGNGGMTDEEYRTHMSLWSMLAAPLLAGNDVAHMSAATKAILLNREVIAIDQDTAAKPAHLAKQQGNTEVWTRPLADGSLAVALFNRDEQPQTVSVSAADIGLKGKPHVRDLWLHKNVAFTKTGYSASVPGHGVVLLRVRK